MVAMWERFAKRSVEGGVALLPPELMKHNTSAAAADECTARCETFSECDSVVLSQTKYTKAYRCQMHANVTLSKRAAETVYRLVRRDDVRRPSGGASSSADGGAAHPPVSVALCITGVAAHASIEKREKPGLTWHPIYDEATYRGLAAWRAELASLGVATHVFLVLDLALGWQPRSTDVKTYAMARDTARDTHTAPTARRGTHSAHSARSAHLC